MSKKDTLKKKIPAEIFSKFADTIEISLNDAYVSTMQAISQLSVFSEKGEHNRERVWHIFAKKSICPDIDTAKKDFSKALKKFKKAIKEAEDSFDNESSKWGL